MHGAHILIWEQWRRSWRGLALVTGSLFLYATLLYFVDRLIFIGFANNPNIALGAAYIPVAGAIALVFLHESRNQIDFAFPKRMLWLPIHTHTVVITQYAFKLVVVAVISTLAGWVCLNFIKVTYAIFPQVLLFLTITAALQALVLLVAGYGAGTGTAWFLAAFAIGAILLYPIYDAVAINFGIQMPLDRIEPAWQLAPEFDEDQYYPSFTNWPWWGAAASLVWWLIVAYIGARQARSEVPADPVGRMFRISSNLTYLDRDADTFPSAEAAQRWFEWRRSGFLFPWLSAALGIILVVTFRGTLDEEESRFVISFSLLAVAPAIVAVILGYSLTRSDPKYLWFVSAKPLSNQVLARAKLVMAMKAIATAYILLAIVYFIANMIIFQEANPVASLVNDIRTITTTTGPFSEGLALLAASLLITIVAVWSLFWLGRAGGVIAWLAGMVAIAYSFYEDRDFIDTEAGTISPISIAFGSALTVLAIAGVLFAFAWALKNKLITIRTVAIALIAWILLAAPTLLFREIAGERSIPIMILWLLIPLAPVATVPLSVAWHRYR